MSLLRSISTVLLAVAVVGCSSGSLGEQSDLVSPDPSVEESSDLPEAWQCPQDPVFESEGLEELTPEGMDPVRFVEDQRRRWILELEPWTMKEEIKQGYAAEEQSPLNGAPLTAAEKAESDRRPYAGDAIYLLIPRLEALGTGADGGDLWANRDGGISINVFPGNEQFDAKALSEEFGVEIVLVERTYSRADLVEAAEALRTQIVAELPEDLGEKVHGATYRPRQHCAVIVASVADYATHDLLLRAIADTGLVDGQEHVVSIAVEA